MASAERAPGPASADTMAMIMRTLEGDPRLARAFSALKQDAEAAGLLGSSCDWQGNSRPSTYEQAITRVGAAPEPAHLQRLLGRLVDFSRDQARSATRLPSAPWSLLRN